LIFLNKKKYKQPVIDIFKQTEPNNLSLMHKNKLKSSKQVQEDLADRDNEFEIVDFLKINFKHSVGIERAPPPISATDKEENDENDQQENPEQVNDVTLFL